MPYARWDPSSLAVEVLTERENGPSALGCVADSGGKQLNMVNPYRLTVEILK